MLLAGAAPRMLTTQVRFAGSGAGIDGWRDFVQRHRLVALWDYDLLQLTAGSPDPQCPTLCAAVRHRDDIVGIFVGTYRGVRPKARPNRFEPILIDMRMPGQGHVASWALRPDLTHAQQVDVVRAFEREMIRTFGRHRLAGVAYRNVTDEQKPVLTRRGAVVRKAEGQGTIMPLPPSYEEWLAGLSKKRRKSLRRYRPIIEAQVEVRMGTGRTDLDPNSVAALAASMAERNEVLQLDPRPQMPAAYFAALMARDDVATISYQRGDELVAVGTMMLHPQHPWGSWWAMVHPRDGGVPNLYFDHFMRYAEFAIERGALTLSSGRGYVEDKVSVGFEITPLSFVGVTRPLLG